MYRKALTSDSLSTTTFFLDKDFPSPPLGGPPTGVRFFFSNPFRSALCSLRSAVSLPQGFDFFYKSLCMRVAVVGGLLQSAERRVQNEKA